MPEKLHATEVDARNKGQLGRVLTWKGRGVWVPRGERLYLYGGLEPPAVSHGAVGAVGWWGLGTREWWGLWAVGWWGLGATGWEPDDQNQQDHISAGNERSQPSTSLLPGSLVVPEVSQELELCKDWVPGRAGRAGQPSRSQSKSWGFRAGGSGVGQGPGIHPGKKCPMGPVL